VRLRTSFSNILYPSMASVSGVSTEV